MQTDRMQHRHWSGQRRSALTTILTFLLLLSLMPAAHADDDTTASPDAPTQADDGALEVGVWYVVDYPPAGVGGPDLPATAPDALGLRDRLTQRYYPFFPFELFPTPRWTARYTYANGSAWESDWGSNEEFYIDNVDLAYFAGHGSKTGIYFGVGGNTHNDNVATAEDAQYRWGTKDNDWIALAACNVLDDPYDPNLRRWARAMNGTRLLMGMKTVMSDTDLGAALGWHIRWNNSMAQAWFRAVNDKLPSWQIARILGEETYNYNDRWYNHDDNQPVDSDFYWWTHQSGTAVALAVDVNRLTAASAAGNGGQRWRCRFSKCSRWVSGSARALEYPGHQLWVDDDRDHYGAGHRAGQWRRSITGDQQSVCFARRRSDDG
ncbi:MAG: DUF6345 domain-containing protein [Caldilineaceae bacterium]